MQKSKFLRSALLFLMLSSTIPVGAAQFNPFTGDTDGSPLSPKRARKTQSGLDSLPPLPLAAPVVVGLPVAGATGQGGGLVGQDKKNTYKIAGTVDGEVVVLDNMNSMFILKNGEIFDGCVVNDPFIDCTPQAVEKAESAKKQKGQHKKNEPNTPVSVKEHSKQADKSNTVKEATPYSGPSWFNISLAQSYSEKTLGQVEIIIEGPNILSVKAPVVQEAVISTALARYIRMKEVFGDYVYYKTEGLVVKGGK